MFGLEKNCVFGRNIWFFYIIVKHTRISLNKHTKHYDGWKAFVSITLKDDPLHVNGY